MMERGEVNVRSTTYHASSSFLSLATGFLLLPWASSALAQAEAKPTPLERSASEVPGVASPKYDGVVPGGESKNPLPSAPQGGAYLVWTGFQMTAKGSEVFLQTTQAVDVEKVEKAKSSKSALVLRLHGCRIHMANNRRKIDTRYFATPVSSVSAKQKGRDVEVHIALREPTTVDPHNQAGPDGTQFVVLDFPPGKATPEPSALQELAADADGQGGSRAEARADRPGRTAGRTAMTAAAKASQ